MGFLSDLMKNKDVRGAVDKLKGAAQTVAKELEKGADELQQSVREEAARHGSASPQAEARREEYDAPRSGDSWGDEMPDEENQYNFGGTYDAYFRHIFAEDFPAWRVEAEDRRGGNGKIYSFYGEAGKALVVEVQPETSAAQAVKKQCAREGVPYLRFYHDHDGWWNTRSYVTRRIRAVLG